MITVAGVQRAVLCLDDARVMIRAGLRSWFVEFQVPFPFPGPAFIVGDLHGETVTVALGVVADEDPVAVAQRSDLGAGAGIGQVAVGHFAPRLAAIAGFALVKTLRRRAIVAHESEE